MESLVLYYQNRILQKEIAIQEIIQGVMCKTSVPIRIEMPKVVKPFVPDHHPSLNFGAKALSVTLMIKNVIPEFHIQNGGRISYKRLRSRCLKRYPQYRAKIVAGFYATVQRLIEEGAPIKPVPAKKKAGNWTLDPNRTLESLQATNGDNQATLQA
jgi:hypothetical protein